MLCRNLVFTYFAEELQQEVADDLLRSLRSGGALVVGAREVVPDGPEPWPSVRGVYRKR